MDDQTCANPDCNCTLSADAGIDKDGKMYCGEFCAGEGAESGDCNCGHGECEE